MKRLAALLAVLLVALFVDACGAGSDRPIPIDPKSDTCASCRMPISDLRLAAELVAPSEEPATFDDVGCLRDYLLARKAPKGASAWLVDHRTGAWVPAQTAVLSVCSTVSTPMGSHLLAWSDDASRVADPAGSGGLGVLVKDVLPEVIR